MSGAPAASPFKQPKAVFAVAFACVVSFMGIGLVDPILPAISHELNASPSEVTLLFTSYLVVTAVAMLITNCPPGNPPGVSWPERRYSGRRSPAESSISLSIAAVRVRRPRERKGDDDEVPDADLPRSGHRADPAGPGGHA
jgi:hypothetical protein